MFWLGEWVVKMDVGIDWVGFGDWDRVFVCWGLLKCVDGSNIFVGF